MLLEKPFIMANFLSFRLTQKSLAPVNAKWLKLCYLLFQSGILCKAFVEYSIQVYICAIHFSPSQDMSSLKFEAC